MHTKTIAIFIWAGFVPVAGASTIIQSGGNSRASVPLGFYAPYGTIGPSTSFARDGIIRGSVTMPANPADLELFTLPNLAAGTYYLVLDSPTPDSAWQYNFPFLSNYTAAPGVAFLGEQQSQFGSIDAAYTAGSTFSRLNIPVEFAVTGTPSPVPEPGLFPPIGLLIAGLAVLRRRRGRPGQGTRRG